MVDNSYTNSLIKSSNTELDYAILEKLQRYCDYLQQLLENKKSGRIISNQPDQLVDDAELRRGCPNNED
jgi:hypothetical protein